MMTPHLYILIWVILSQCSTGDTKRDDKTSHNLGDPCDNKKLCGGLNLFCNMTVKECQCQKGFPIVARTNIKTLCLQPAKLTDECLHDAACLATDINSDCVQNDHIALCKCKVNYHEIFDKNTQKTLCVLETQLLNSDLATLLGVGAGMTLFCGLTCLVLRIFARARFGPRHHHYANAHLAPPITLSTEHDAERGGPSRHSSQRSSQGGSRRPSTLAPPTRPEGSRRASNSSIRSSASARSYSLKQHSNHHHYHHHRPSDPETHLGFNLNSNQLSITQPKSDTNISRSGQSIHHQNSPNKAKRSGSAGAI